MNQMNQMNQINQIKPVFMLAGGHFRNPAGMVPAMARALRECSREKPRVAYLGVANGDNAIFCKTMGLLLRQAGAGEVFLIPLAKTRADLPAARRALEEADAIFISGGEVDDGMRWLEQHDLVGFLQELRGQGKLFMGLSAGSIMMGTHWVRWENPQDDQTATLFACLGFAPAIFDTHAENEDWKELKMALQLRGTGQRGYGIPSGGLVCVDSQGQMAVLDKDLVCYANNGGQVQKINE